MTTKEMIKILRYKADNIKAKIEPEFFNEVADRLKKIENENVDLKCRCKTFGQGTFCEVCILECSYRPGGYMDKIKAEIFENAEDNLGFEIVKEREIDENGEDN